MEHRRRHRQRDRLGALLGRSSGDFRLEAIGHSAKARAEHTHIMITEPINAVKVLPPIGGEASPVGSGLRAWWWLSA